MRLLGLLLFRPASTLRSGDSRPPFGTHAVLAGSGFFRGFDRAGARWFSQLTPQLRHFHFDLLKLLLVTDERSFQCCPVQTKSHRYLDYRYF
uniref:Uncharacterized protein n=1 Tax=Solibacter usitatus (strain Ellin6076) TaxID=234267 RepID=Q01VL6_SOLUE